MGEAEVEAEDDEGEEADELNDSDDEYLTFKLTFEALQGRDANIFNLLSRDLTEQQKTGIQEVINKALLKEKKIESLKIEASGGYNFQVTNVPTNISFGGSLS